MWRRPWRAARGPCCARTGGRRIPKMALGALALPGLCHGCGVRPWLRPPRKAPPRRRAHHRIWGVRAPPARRPRQACRCARCQALLNIGQARRPRHASGEGSRRQEGSAGGRGGQAPRGVQVRGRGGQAKDGCARAGEAVRGEKGGACRKVPKTDHRNVRRRGVCGKDAIRGGHEGKEGASRQGVVLLSVRGRHPMARGMNLPLQVADGRFAARRSLQGNPGQGPLGVIDSGSTVTCVGLWARKRAGLKFAGEGARLKCVHREHVMVLGTCPGHIDICGGTARQPPGGARLPTFWA